MRVLICEDNFIVAMETEMHLEDLGHESMGIVARSSEALARCEASAPDLVLVDLNLADGRTGLDLVAKLKSWGIPSIIMSGETEYLDGSEDALAVLEKPVHPVLLERTLERVSQQVSA